MTRPLPLSRLLSVAAWRDLGTGAANGDVVIAYQTGERLTRLRLEALDAQTLADALVAIRASQARDATAGASEPKPIRAGSSPADRGGAQSGRQAAARL